MELIKFANEMYDTFKTNVKYIESYPNAMIQIKDEYMLHQTEEDAISYFKNGYFKRKVIDIILNQSFFWRDYLKFSDREQKSIRVQLYERAISDFKEVLKQPVTIPDYMLQEAKELLERANYTVIAPTI